MPQSWAYRALDPGRVCWVGIDNVKATWQRLMPTADAVYLSLLPQSHTFERTGDQATLETGRVRIVGRVKEIIVASTGKKFAPVDVALALTAEPLFKQACAFGDPRPFIGCRLVLGAIRRQKPQSSPGPCQQFSGAIARIKVL